MYEGFDHHMLGSLLAFLGFALIRLVGRWLGLHGVGVKNLSALIEAEEDT